MVPLVAALVDDDPGSVRLDDDDGVDAGVDCTGMRRGVVADIEETTTRLGLALSWRPNKNWTVVGSYDYDDVSSDDANRSQNRDRLGVSARFSF